VDSLKQINNIFKGDKVIWVVFFLLCIVSVIEVYSASSSLGYKSGNYWKAATYHTFLLLIGLGVIVMTLNIKCKFFKLATPILVPLAFFMLILVFFCGTKENDAARWLKIGFIPIQPSEIAKGAMVLATAQILSAMQIADGAAPKAMKYVLITGAFLILPIAPENLSTAVMLSFVVFLMMIIGRVPLKQLGLLVSVCVLLIGLGIGSILAFGKTPENSLTDKEKMHLTEEIQETEDGIPVAIKDKEKNEKKVELTGVQKIAHRFDTWKGRIMEFSNKEEVPPEKFDLDKNGQVGHARIAIVSSNVTGRGPGNSVERDFLSQAFSDFIYAIVIEELGLGGAFVVAFLYVVLLFRTGIIARRCKNPFPAYLAMGLALLMVTQALFNMMVAVGLAPVTGQPLPLISKGGTSSIINCLYIGVILSISRTAARRDDAVLIDN
jgi:cell division protein FtsW